MKCVERTRILRYLAGKLSAEEDALLEKHMAECEVCTGIHDDLVVMAHRLAPDPGEFENTQLADDVMTLVRLGRATPERTELPKSRISGWWLAPVFAAAAVVALLVVGLPYRGDDQEGFQVRGGSALESDRGVSLEIFRSTREGYLPVKDEIGTSDALAFACTNRSGGRFKHLMVLAIDESGRIFWYYPPHQRPGENPESVPIRSGSDRQEMPDEIRHALGTGALRIFGVFSAEPLDVRMVESVVARDLEKAESLHSLERLGLDGTGQHSILLEVVGTPAGGGR